MGIFEIADTGGMICGFRLHPDGPAEALQWNVDAAPGVLPEMPGQPLWLHFNFVDTRADRWIASSTHLTDEVRELLLDTDPRIRLEPMADGLVGVLGDLHHDFEADPEGFGVLRLYIGRELLISGRRHPLESTDRLRHELRAGEQVGSTMQWLSHLVHHLAETFGKAVNEINDTVDEVEDRILAGRIADEGKQLGRVRRLLARLRRQLGGNRQSLSHARARLPAWCTAEDAAQLRLAIERLDTVAQDLELVQERARLLQEEIAGQFSEQTNRNLYMLSIVTTVMLPITLITGVFGMNVAGLPWLTDPVGFWKVMLLMACTAVATLLVLHWRKLF
jgi:zinc transporter